MNLLILSIDNLTTVKRSLRQHLPNVKSSHLSEALARALGFKTNTSALSHIRALTDLEVREFRQDAFVVRLNELGYGRDLSTLAPGLITRVGILTAPAAPTIQDRISWGDPNAILLDLNS